ncbi:glycoside hydrolase family 5 protein [Chiua virens]|nr:glycoside hydrolase family 5 protein [Chiua virens]
MPQVPKTCPATGRPVSQDYLHTFDGHFVGTDGRTVLLRGVNLSGSSKAPVLQPSHVHHDFWSSAKAGGQSFVGRPLNLEDGSADAHLSRLRGWGFNVLRYPITWEALEHDGPGRYDYEFMDYTIRVLHKCKEYGFKVYIDPHQDVWSRFSGGSGAPYWTFPACGIDPEAFTATQAAILHCEYPNASTTPDPATLPSMLWTTNYSRLASQTMFTLFFGGKTFAPKCILDGINIQDYLQDHFIQAFGVLADRIRDVGGLLDDVVIGWDSMNEPSEGFIGHGDLSVYSTAQGSVLKKGSLPTPLQSFKLGMGVMQKVHNYTVGSFGSQHSGSVTIDPTGIRIWMDPSTESNGVHPKWGWKRSREWTLGTCTTFVMLLPLNRPGRLVPPTATRRSIHFLDGCFLPHLTDYITRIRAAHPSAIAFVQAPSLAIPPRVPESLLKGRGCHSTHYYDGLTLVTRRWQFFNADTLGIIRGEYISPILAARLGEWAIRTSFQTQLAALKSDSAQLGFPAAFVDEQPKPRRCYPTMVGEIGTPMDMDDKKAYDSTSNGHGIYSNQERALDASLNATDGPNVLNYTLWTYCPDNTHLWGDGWNNEDLSLWSADDVRGKLKNVEAVAGSPAAARASNITVGDIIISVRAFCRPYPVKVVGTPVDIQFDIRKASLKIKVHVTPADLRRETTATGGRAGEEGSSRDKGVNAREESALPTEIFIPLVHFASEGCVERSVADQEHGQRLYSENSDGVANVCETKSRNGSMVTLTSTGSKSPASGKVELIDTDGYTVQVKVSEGRVEIDEKEQRLRWYYAVPASGKKDLSIEVKRVRGAIDWDAVTRRSRSDGVWNGDLDETGTAEKSLEKGRRNG